jgi:hypothetical protein
MQVQAHGTMVNCADPAFINLGELLVLVEALLFYGFGKKNSHADVATVRLN